jgi:hypothetical protein
LAAILNDEVVFLLETAAYIWLEQLVLYISIAFSFGPAHVFKLL